MKTMRTLLSLFLLAACLMGCGKGTPDHSQGITTTAADSSASAHTDSDLPATPDGPAVGSGTLYRGDLIWYGYTNQWVAKTLIIGSRKTDDRNMWERIPDDTKLAFQIQYNLIDFHGINDWEITKSFFDFTDSDEDLAFYNAEVEYFESLGIEVLKDHRCANSTPGQTNGVVPALVVAMNKEQYDNLATRNGAVEMYRVYGAAYALAAPSDTPDLHDMQKEDEEWEMDEHPYRSDVFWVYMQGVDYVVPNAGDKQVFVSTPVLSPSDRMAVLISVGLYDSEAALLKAAPEYAIQNYRDYLESLGIEIWEDCLPDPGTSAQYGGFLFYASITMAQIESITASLDDSYRIVALNYEQFITETFPELAG